MDCTITDEGWTIGGPTIKLSKSDVAKEAVPYISDPAAWTQYSDEFIYEFEIMFREWLKIMSENTEWCRKYRYRRYTTGMLWEILTGNKWNCKTDSKYSTKIAKIFAYYSCKIQKSGVIDNKHYTKTVYTISPPRLKNPPYSLKLRLEWLYEQGEIPTRQNMKLPKDDLKPGHARNPRTEENMRLRHEEGNRRYQEWKRAHDAANAKQ